MTPCSCKIEINIQRDGYWEVTINDKKLKYPRKFQINLDREIGIPSYTVELDATIPQD